MPQVVFPKFKYKVLTKEINLLTETIVALVLKSSATPSLAWEFISDAISGSQEISVAGYARYTFVNKTLVIGGSNVTFDNTVDADFGSPATGQTMGYIVLAKSTGDNATSPVIGYLYGGSSPNELPKATNGTPFTFRISASGLLVM